MRYGIHLPHAGEQATPGLIRRHAETMAYMVVEMYLEDRGTCQ